MSQQFKFEFKIGGKEVNPIKYFTLEQSLFQHHSFSLRIPFREKKDALLEQEYTGKMFEVSKLEGKNDRSPFFKGVVTACLIDRQHGGSVEMVLSGFSLTYLMDVAKDMDSFTDMNLQKIVEEIVDHPGYKVIKDTLINDPAFLKSLAYSVQFKETDFQYLSRLANDYGEWFFYDGTSLIFGKRPDAKAAPIALGSEMSTLDTQVSLRSVLFTHEAYDAYHHKHLKSDSAAASVDNLDNHGKKVLADSESLFSINYSSRIHHYVSNQDELDRIVKRKKSAIAAGMITLKGTSKRPIMFGVKVSITGFVENDNSTQKETFKHGEYFITQLSHTYDGMGNYNNAFLAIPATIDTPPENPLVKYPEAHPMTAEVVERKDPEKINRVRVQFGWQTKGESTPYIHCLSMNAGAGRGGSFQPHVGDRVFVFFNNGDPEQPVVVGSHFHTQAVPKIPDFPDHLSQLHADEKTKDAPEQHMIQLGKSSMVMTGGGIVLSSGASSLDITPTGITLKGDKIEFKGGEFVKGKATKIDLSGSSSAIIDGGPEAELKATKVTVKAGSAMDVSGATTKVTASGEMNVEGGGITNIKGALVKIN